MKGLLSQPSWTCWCGNSFTFWNVDEDHNLVLVIVSIRMKVTFVRAQLYYIGYICMIPTDCCCETSFNWFIPQLLLINAVALMATCEMFCGVTKSPYIITYHHMLYKTKLFSNTKKYEYWVIRWVSNHHQTSCYISVPSCSSLKVLIWNCVFVSPSLADR